MSADHKSALYLAKNLSDETADLPVNTWTISREIMGRFRNLCRAYLEKCDELEARATEYTGLLENANADYQENERLQTERSLFLQWAVKELRPSQWASLSEAVGPERLDALLHDDCNHNEVVYFGRESAGGARVPIVWCRTCGAIRLDNGIEPNSGSWLLPRSET